MVEIHGNTYAIRDQLKALGGKWNAAKKCWMVPADKAEAAKSLLPKSSGAGRSYTPKTCATCGVRINYGRFCGKCEFA